MTVGTDDKTALKIHGIKLLPSHDYAVTGRLIVRKLPCIVSFVTDIRESKDERWVTLLDSRVCSLSSECVADAASNAYSSEYLLFCRFCFAD